MRHLRQDYNAIQPWPVKRPHLVKRPDGSTGEPLIDGFLTNGEAPIIADDEPVFVLRGQDPAAARAVRTYAAEWLIHGGDPDVARQLLGWADEMEAYAAQAGHGAPDVPAEFLP